MKKRTVQKEQTRQRILAFAKDAFEAQGFESANLRQIAQSARIATGTIFVHFKDKQDLLHAALFEDLTETLRLALAAPPGDSLEGWLTNLVDQILDYYEKRPLLSRVLLKESLLAEPPWAERFAAQVGEMHAGVAARTAVSCSNGEFTQNLNPQVFGAAFISFYMFGLIAWVQKTHPDPRALIQVMVAQHLAGYKIKGNNPK